VFLHQAHHLLVVDEAASGMQFGGHTPIAVARPFCADRLDAFDKPSLFEADLNLGIHTLVEGIATDPVVIDASSAATHSIDYVVTDAAGQAG
jgi:hypothetical protein